MVSVRLYLLIKFMQHIARSKGPYDITRNRWQSLAIVVIINNI